MSNFAETMFAFHEAESTFTDALCDAGFGGFKSIGGDHYDCSIEFYGVDNSARMSPEQQRLVFEAGFIKAYVNHEDGWETHYFWGKEFSPQRGWRRRYVNDPNATTTNVVGGPPKPGYYEISYWPEGWETKQWLETGYMRIVPDPLETVTV